MSVIELEGVETTVGTPMLPTRRGVSREEVASTCDRAADLLESGEWEWGQGAVRNGDSLCAIGALAIARGHVVPPVTKNLGGKNYGDGPFTQSVAAMSSAVGGSASHWNDTPGRTQAEVVAKLRETARAARA